ncbi:MAG: hypothetical protein PWP57_12 [Candidatus Atribacteria bacterium]|nr:hypothetical protein [Candidatus Atribacteria bacterium]
MYGLLLFWVLNERLKDLDYLLSKLKEETKEVNNKLALLLDFKNEGEESKEEDTLEETFSLRTLQGETKKKGDKS